MMKECLQNSEQSSLKFGEVRGPCFVSVADPSFESAGMKVYVVNEIITCRPIFRAALKALTD